MSCLLEAMDKGHGNGIPRCAELRPPKISRGRATLASIWLVVSVSSTTVCLGASTAEAVHFGDGIKTGEVTPHSAIVWARLTAADNFNLTGPAFGHTDDAVPAGHTLGDMRYSLMGTSGEVRFSYQPEDAPNDLRWTAWRSVDPARDFTVQFPLQDLRSNSRYNLVAEGRAPGQSTASARIEGRFETAPEAGSDANVDFVVVTCHDFGNRDDGDNGHKIYRSMLALDPAFLVHTGDFVYYDRAEPYAKSPELARYKWDRMFAFPDQRAFFRQVATYFMKDDHDTLKNDSWPGQTYGDLTWDEGLAIFREEVPMGASTYRTYRWGRNLQIWMVEGRDYRSPDDMPDGPDKTIWGAEQKKWFFDTLQSSDATFRILITPTPLVGPDRAKKQDNLANRAFATEGEQIRKFVAAQKNAFVITGDRHWQYASVDSETGLWEFGSGPGSDAHAGGFRLDMRTPEQRFLRIKGGFLEVKVSDEPDGPHVVFLHHDVDGNVVHREAFPAHHDSSPSDTTRS